MLIRIRVRKELKIRPGFTPQEDQTRFRGSRQQEAEQNALPKGHIPGWVPPSSASKPKPKAKAATSSGGARSLEALATGGSGITAGLSAQSTKEESAPLSKSAKKSAKRQEKKKEDKQKALEEKIRAAWDDDSDDDIPTPAKKGKSAASKGDSASKPPNGEGADDDGTKQLTTKVAELNV